MEPDEPGAVRLGRRRRVVIAVAVLLGLYLAWLTGLWVFQRWLIYPGQRLPAPQGAAAAVEGVERWWLDIPESRVEAWFLPGDGVSGENPGPAVIYVHGNAEIIDQLPPRVARYRDMGLGVLLPELRGYGRSGGSPSQEAIVDDLLRFHDRLVARPDVEGIVVHGRSLGAGPGCALAARREPDAVIVESTFTSLTAFAPRLLVPKALVRDPWNNLSAVSGLDVPLLIFHGLDDRTVPFSHAVRLHDTAPRSRLVRYDCGHNDLPPDPRHYWRTISIHLREAGVIGQQGASEMQQDRPRRSPETK
ncbi:MAG: alpha/beta hydrolase [Myxococcota bacterium]